MKFSEQKKRLLINTVMLLLILLIVAEPAFAGTSSSGQNNPFASMVQLLIGWLKGGLGLMLALLGLGVGLVAGIGRGSLAGGLTGVGIAICAYWGPDILQGIFGAVVLHSQQFITVASF